MRWQALVGCFAVGLLVISPLSATVIDFSTDPQLSTDWTLASFYDGGVSGDSTTVTWNSSNQDLDLASSYDEKAVILFKNGTTRTDTDTVTLTVKDYSQGGSSPSWTGTGLMISAVQSPGIWDTSACYRFEVYANGGSPEYTLKTASNTLIGTHSLESFPSTIKLDIVRDGSEYVFKANDQEIFRDSTYASDSLSYYSIGWGSSGSDTLTARVDNFGTIPVPEPNTLVLLLIGLLGLLAYAWRKRR